MVNRVGHGDGGLVFAGGSAVVDPYGRLRGRARRMPADRRTGPRPVAGCASGLPLPRRASPGPARRAPRAPGRPARAADSLIHHGATGASRRPPPASERARIGPESRSTTMGARASAGLPGEGGPCVPRPGRLRATAITNDNSGVSSNGQTQAHPVAGFRGAVRHRLHDPHHRPRDFRHPRRDHPGTRPAAYIAASLAMLFTALSYGRMAAAFPVAGSAYTYVRKAIDSRLGFIAGWAVLLDYLFLPMAIWLIGAAYLHSAFPAVPNAVGAGVHRRDHDDQHRRPAPGEERQWPADAGAVPGPRRLRRTLRALRAGRPGQAAMVTATVARWRPAGAAGDERCGDRLLLVPRFRRGQYPDRGNPRPAAQHPAGDPADHPAGRVDLHRHLVLRATGAPVVRLRQRGLGGLRDRPQHRWRPVRDLLPGRPDRRPVHLRPLGPGQRLAPALRHGPRRRPSAAVLRASRQALRDAGEQHRPVRRGGCWRCRWT